MSGPVLGPFGNLLFKESQAFLKWDGTLCDGMLFNSCTYFSNMKISAAFSASPCHPVSPSSAFAVSYISRLPLAICLSLAGSRYLHTAFCILSSFSGHPFRQILPRELNTRWGQVLLFDVSLFSPVPAKDHEPHSVSSIVRRLPAGRQGRAASLLLGPIKILIFPRNRERNADNKVRIQEI